MPKKIRERQDIPGNRDCSPLKDALLKIADELEDFADIRLDCSVINKTVQAKIRQQAEAIRAALAKYPIDGGLDSMLDRSRVKCD